MAQLWHRWQSSDEAGDRLTLWPRQPCLAEGIAGDSRFLKPTGAPMAYLDLDRRFVNVTAEEIAPWYAPPSVSWEVLLQETRVVLVGEALCGKTSEFEAQYRGLRGRGRFAFFVRCNELVDQNLKLAMPLEDGKSLDRWLEGTSTAWLFLDAVDEMAGSIGSLPRVLRLLLDVVGEAGMQRARLFVSCRAGEWQGEADSEAISKGLPSFRDLSPRDSEIPSSAKGQPIVVRLEPLGEDQMLRLAAARGLADAMGLLARIERDGLKAFAERPGDFLHLVDYWREHGNLGTYEQIADNAISKRLRESSSTRRVDDGLSIGRARHGAERLAAILCLAQKATLSLEGGDSGAAVDSGLVLDDFSDAERRSLLNRGLFVQSSMGRLQFHHISSQRFLAAKFFDSLLERGHPLKDVLDIFFPTIFEIRSFASHLAEVAAWLALWHSAFAREMADRKPDLLLRPEFLSRATTAVKDRVWSRYAATYERGEMTLAPVSTQEVVLLEDPAIEERMRLGWRDSTRDADLRRRIMRIVERGRLNQYRDLVREAALDRSGNEFLRFEAILAAVSIGDDTTVRRIAKELAGAESGTFGMFCRPLARALYPRYLSRTELITFLWRQERPADEEMQTHGLQSALYGIFGEQQTMIRLINGFLDDLSVPPRPAGAKVRKIVADLIEPLTARVILSLEGDRPSEPLHRLIARLQLQRRRPSPQEGPFGFAPLEYTASRNPQVNQRLFWSFVEEKLPPAGLESAERLLKMQGDHLWRLTGHDLEWLCEDVLHRADPRQRKLAISVIVAILGQSFEIFTQPERLRKLVAADAELQSQLFDDLCDALFGDDWSGTYEELFARIERERRELFIADPVKDWEELRDSVKSRPSSLLARSSTAELALYSMILWLARQTETPDDVVAAASQWHLLRDEIGHEGTESYRDSVKAFWRRSRPGRGSVIDYSLRLIGFTVERLTDPCWAAKLDAAEVRCALAHLCREGPGYTPFLDDLLKARPEKTSKAIQRVVSREWRSPRRGPVPFLVHLATVETGIPPILVPSLLALLTKHEAPEPGVFEVGIGILQRLAKSQNKRIMKFARRGIAQHAGTATEGLASSTLAGDERAVQFLLLALSADAPSGIAQLRNWLDDASPTVKSDLAEYLFGFLFGESKIRQRRLLASLTVYEISTLLGLFLDYHDPGTESISERIAICPGKSFETEVYRSAWVRRAWGLTGRFLQALFAKGGPEAYEALVKLEGDGRLAGRSPSPAELARQLIELQAVGEPWTLTRFHDFERRYPLVAKTGADLYRIVLGVLDNLDAELALNDADIRPLLAGIGRDEEKMKKWLMRELIAASRARYEVVQEIESSSGNRPDIVVSIATAQVAIEVKQADSWSTSRLLTALHGQLANDYLLTKSRRHGILLLTNHDNRSWLHPDNGTLMDFSGLVSFLQNEAKARSANIAGTICVAVRGLDVSVEKAEARRQRSRRGALRSAG